MVQERILARYIGIPWRLGGRSLQGTDCLGLIIMVQRDIFGVHIPDRWQYDSGNICELSLRMPEEMLALGFEEVPSPCNGDLCFAEIRGCGHLATWLWGGHLTITQYTRSSWKPRRFPFRYFRPWGVRTW